MLKTIVFCITYTHTNENQSTPKIFDSLQTVDVSVSAVEIEFSNADRISMMLITINNNDLSERGDIERSALEFVLFSKQVDCLTGWDHEHPAFFKNENQRFF